MASACGALAVGGAWRNAGAGCLKEAARLIVEVCVSMARDLRFPELWVAAEPRSENSDNVPKGYPGGGSRHTTSEEIPILSLTHVPKCEVRESDRTDHEDISCSFGGQPERNPSVGHPQARGR